MSSGVELATAWVRLVPSADGIQGELSKTLGPEAEKAGDDAGQKAGKKFSNGMKVAAAAGAAALTGAVVSIFQTGMEELKFGEQINAQTQLLIDNTGFTMKTDEINDFTLALSKVSGVSEEDLQAAGNNIIKFGNVSEENYKKAVNSINDLAATGKDASAVSEGLGKALADPATAAGKLRKMGIQLTEQQEEQIKTMTEAGDIAGAQSLILDSLESTYGGMAEAAGGTLEGNINKLQNSWENTAGSIVEMVMPAMEGLIGILQNVVGFIEEHPAVAQALAIGLGVLTLAFGGLTVATWAMNTALLANPITWIVLAVIALIAAIVWLIMNWDAVVAFLQEVWANVCAWFTDTLNNLASLWNDIWSNICSFFETIWTAIADFFRTVWEGVVSWFTGLLDSIAAFILSTLNNINSFWTSVWNGIVSFFTGLWNGVVSFVDGVFTGIGNAISTALDWIRGVWEGAWSGIVDFFGNIFGGLVGIAKAPINGVISLINGAIRALNGFKVTIPDWVPGIGGQTWGLSIPTIPGLRDGGTVTGTGYVMVGEEGPEILKLPKGAQVNPDYDDLPDDSGRGVTFNNYAPLGSTPSQELETFANRSEAFLP